MRLIASLISPFISVIILSLTLAGCMLGPDFHSPRSPDVSSYTVKPLGKKTVSTKKSPAGRAQRFMVGEDIPADWWHLYRSRALNALIERGLVNSPSLASSQAALRQAEEALNVQVGNLLFPAVNAQLLGQRQRFPGTSIGSDFPPSIFNLFNATLNVSYTLDVFGASRRQIESLRAQVDYQQYELIASYLTLTSNIVTMAVTVASLEDQIKATRELIREQEAQLQIIDKQYELGSASLENVLSQQTLVDQTISTLPVLQQRHAQAYHALAVLVGDFPNGRLPRIKLSDLNLPNKLPVSVPSKLVRQRPDVQASEALLHAASAQIGVATANLFPQFTLTGNYGWSGNIPSTLFQPFNKVWAYGGSLTQPLFQGGALLAQRREAIAAFRQAYANYRQTVLLSFQNVADSLRAVQNDARRFKALTMAENAARKNVTLTRDQYRLGGASYLNLLNAEQQYQQTVIARIQAQAARYNDTTALFQALGGGWWNRNKGFCHLGENVQPDQCT